MRPVVGDNPASADIAARYGWAMNTFSRPVAAVLFVLIFIAWIVFRGIPDSTGFVRILINLVASVIAIGLLFAIWERSDWKPGD